MKKTVKNKFFASALLALILAFSLSACSDKPDTGAPSSDAAPSGDISAESAASDISSTDGAAPVSSETDSDPDVVSDINASEDVESEPVGSEDVSSSPVSSQPISSQPISSQPVSSQSVSSEAVSSAAVSSDSTSSTGDDPYADLPYSAYDVDESFDEGSAVTIDLSTAGSKINITQTGTYILSGTAENTQIYINATKDDHIQLVLKNADITCLTGSPVYSNSADKLKITLAPGTVNTVTTKASSTAEIDSNACIYSKDDLTINGSGKLTVNANQNNGIGSKDDIRIINGNITVSDAKNGVKGKDSVLITGGSLTVKCSKDGLKSSNEEKKGTVTVSGGSVDIDAGDDGLQATAGIAISGGKVSVKSEGKVTNCEKVTVAPGCLTVAD